MSGIIATKDYDNGTLLLEMSGKTNSFTSELLTELEMWLDHASIDKQLHSIIITGNSRIFSVGGDINEMKVYLEQGEPESYIKKIVPKINSIIKKIFSHPLIIISAINGSAAGGGLSLALSCDIKYSVLDAKLVPAFSALNLTPDSGSSITLVRNFGYSRSLMSLLTSETITAEEAYKLGALDKIVEQQDLMGEVTKLASQLKNVNRDVISKTKSLMNSGILKNIDSQLQNEFDSIFTAIKAPSFAENLNNILKNPK